MSNQSEKNLAQMQNNIGLKFKTIGMENLGASCYINATLQFINAMPNIDDFADSLYTSINHKKTGEVIKSIRQTMNSKNNGDILNQEDMQMLISIISSIKETQIYENRQDDPSILLHSLFIDTPAYPEIEMRYNKLSIEQTQKNIRSKFIGIKIVDDLQKAVTGYFNSFHEDLTSLYYIDLDYSAQYLLIENDSTKTADSYNLNDGKINLPNGCEYTLISGIFHTLRQNNGSTSGHYITLIKSETDKHFYKFNDTYVDDTGKTGLINVQSIDYNIAFKPRYLLFQKTGFTSNQINPYTKNIETMIYCAKEYKKHDYKNALRILYNVTREDVFDKNLESKLKTLINAIDNMKYEYDNMKILFDISMEELTSDYYFNKLMQNDILMIELEKLKQKGQANLGWFSGPSEDFQKPLQLFNPFVVAMLLITVRNHVLTDLLKKKEQKRKDEEETKKMQEKYQKQQEIEKLRVDVQKLKEKENLQNQLKIPQNIITFVDFENLVLNGVYLFMSDDFNKIIRSSDKVIEKVSKRCRLYFRLSLLKLHKTDVSLYNYLLGVTDVDELQNNVNQIEKNVISTLRSKINGLTEENAGYVIEYGMYLWLINDDADYNRINKMGFQRFLNNNYGYSVYLVKMSLMRFHKTSAWDEVFEREYYKKNVVDKEKEFYYSSLRNIYNNLK